MKKKKSASDLEFVFFGTPQFAVYVLDELEKAGLVPALVVTQPDRPAGRGLALQEPAAKTWAAEHSVAVLQPVSPGASRGGNDLDLLYNSEFDLFVVAAYGKLLPEKLLRVPRSGTLNVHPSLLPKFRGPSPIESQILADERECGTTIMLLDNEMDHGPIVAQASVTPEEWPVRASVLEEMLARAGGELLAETIPLWLDLGNPEEGYPDPLTPEPQDHAKATFTKKIEKEDGLLEIRHPMSDIEAYQNYLKFCAYDGWPGTFFFVNEKRVKITDAEYRDGKFIPLKVIPEGKKEISYQDFLRKP